MIFLKGFLDLFTFILACIHFAADFIIKKTDLSSKAELSQSLAEIIIGNFFGLYFQQKISKNWKFQLYSFSFNPPNLPASHCFTTNFCLNPLTQYP